MLCTSHRSFLELSVSCPIYVTVSEDKATNKSGVILPSNSVVPTPSTIRLGHSSALATAPPVVTSLSSSLPLNLTLIDRPAAADDDDDDDADSVGSETPADTAAVGDRVRGCLTEHRGTCDDSGVVAIRQVEQKRDRPSTECEKDSDSCSDEFEVICACVFLYLIIAI